MKKSMLCAGLMIILCTTAYAENANPINTMQTKPVPIMQGTGVAVTPSTTPQTTTTPGKTIKGAQPPTTSQPKQGMPIATPQDKVTPQKSLLPITPSMLPQSIDCNYRIPAETTHIEQTLVSKWAEKAVAQSFEFEYNTLDTQLAALKTCYTDQGWQSFNDALQKSGNLVAIKSQKLMLSSMVNGATAITEIKDNQWKVILPMQVVYQNDKEKLTQLLTVNLVIGRKVSGDLGIMQMIATPRQASEPSNAPTNSSGAPVTTPATTSKAPQ